MNLRPGREPKMKLTTPEVEQIYSSGYGGEVFTPATTDRPPKPRKHHRIFLWVFLAVQAGFIAWLAFGLSQQTGPSHADIASLCGNGGWQGLWKSYQDCAAHSGLTAAGDVGKGIGLGIVIAIWCVVDFLLAVIYGVYRLARRPQR